MTFQEFRTKYGNFITFVELYVIITAIPQHMKEIIRNNIFEDDTWEPKYSEFICEGLDSKFFYNEFIDSPSVLQKNYRKMGNYLRFANDY